MAPNRKKREHNITQNGRIYVPHDIEYMNIKWNNVEKRWIMYGSRGHWCDTYSFIGKWARKNGSGKNIPKSCQWLYRFPFHEMCVGRVKSTKKHKERTEMMKPSSDQLLLFFESIRDDFFFLTQHEDPIEKHQPIPQKHFRPSFFIRSILCNCQSPRQSRCAKLFPKMDSISKIQTFSVCLVFSELLCFEPIWSNCRIECVR